MIPEEIREALAFFPHNELPDDPTAQDHDVYTVIVEAARAYADLLDRGQVEDYCETHDNFGACINGPTKPHRWVKARRVVAPVGEVNK